MLRRTEKSPRHTLLIVVAAVVWAATVLYGGKTLWTYKTTPSAAAHAPTMWPAGASIALDTRRANLVMLAHPQCPCTRASIVELNELVSVLRGEIAVHIFFLRPEGFDDAWVKSASWADAHRIPGVSIRIDEEGREAARFGAVTSGQALVYGRDGALLFSGGLTAVRGHVGKGAGFDRIVSIIKKGKADSVDSLVFGCSLVTPDNRQQSTGGSL